ncbi:VOC family protein [Janibacter corallicola]|uniref:VOC family protein n=1 Tax=Janibacter corallicola TaxID=415212 RepID=UPI0008308078|nr:VOC family protein [Janibacter corallicola]
MLTGRRPPHDYLGTVLDAPDPRALGRFYAEVLDWRIHSDEDDWVTIAPDQGHVYLAFQKVEDHSRPVWPAQPDQQQIQMHLDIEVSDLEAATESALRLGGLLSEHQPQEGQRVVIDPAGHLFCIYVGDSESST